MKKASNIMYLVSMIFGIIGAVVLFIFGIGSIICGCIPEIHDAIVQGVEGTEEAKTAVLAIYIGSMVGSGVVLLFMAAFDAVSAVLCHKARTNGSRKLYIVNIVFGALGGNDVAIAASILAIIAENKEKKRKEIEVDGQPKEEKI